MFVLRVEELRVHVNSFLEIKRVDVKDRIDRDGGTFGSDDRCGRVDRLEPGLDPLDVGFVHQVHLVEDHPVGESNLLDRLVLGALRLLLVQVLFDVLSVHEGDDAVQAEVLLDVVIDEEGLRDRRRVRHSGGLDQDAVQFKVAGCDAVGKLVKHHDQILAHGAADAAVHHFDNLLLDLHLRVLGHERVVNADVTKLVFDDRDLLAVILVGQDVVHQSGLSAAEIASQDGDRHSGVIVCRRHSFLRTRVRSKWARGCV